MTRGFILRSKERDWPIPPPAPRTATLVRCGADAEKKREEGAAKARTAARANMREFYKETVRWRWVKKYIYINNIAQGRVTPEHHDVLPEDSFLYIYPLGSVYHNDSTTTNTGSQGTCRTKWPGSNCHAFLPKGGPFFGLKGLFTFLNYQVWSLSLSLAEILVIFANVHPSSNISRVVIAVLVRSASSTPSEIRLTWTFIFGWICAISGAYIRRSCYQTLGRMFTFELSLRKNHQLVTSGPYSVVRHPSYIGGALALFGALACYTSPGSWFIECSGLFLPSWAGSVVFLCWFIAGSTGWLVISPRVKKEDAMLKKEFGLQWDAWAADVPYRLIPGVY